MNFSTSSLLRLSLFVIAATQVYVCIDEENTLAEMPFYCDPDRMGTEACYENAAGANEKALRIHVGIRVAVAAVVVRSQPFPPEHLINVILSVVLATSRRDSRCTVLRSASMAMREVCGATSSDWMGEQRYAKNILLVQSSLTALWMRSRFRLWAACRQDNSKLRLRASENLETEFPWPMMERT